MPIDSMMLDPMLNPFRDMVKDCESKGITGDDFDQMKEMMALMERLGQEMSDIAAYSGKLAQDQIFMKFSDAYSRALAGAASQAASASPQSDEEMMAQNLKAYEDALATYRSGQAGESAQLLIPALERILEIGRSGVSYPVFLRMLEEQGLNRALDGAAPAARAGLEKDVGFAEESWDPLRVEETRKKLALFDAIAEKAPFGEPEPLEFELGRRRIEWEFAPRHALRKAIIDRWEYILDKLVDWVDSFTQFAPWDERWRPPGASEEQVRKNIARTQECGPGQFRYREAIFQEYFGLGFADIFTHETYRHEYTARRVEWSDERLQLIWDTYAHCRPGQRPPDELIARAEELHPDRDLRENRRQSPPWGTPLEGYVPK